MCEFVFSTKETKKKVLPEIVALKTRQGRKSQEYSTVPSAVLYDLPGLLVDPRVKPELQL